MSLANLANRIKLTKVVIFHNQSSQYHIGNYFNFSIEQNIWYQLIPIYHFRVTTIYKKLIYSKVRIIT